MSSRFKRKIAPSPYCEMRRCLAMLLTALLAGCATLGGAAGLPTGDTTNWVGHSIELGDHIVRFTIPPGVNKEFLDPTIPQQVNLQEPGIFDRTGRGPRILSRHWDYRSNSVALVDGTLRAAIWVKYSEKSLIDSNALKASVSEEQELSHMKDAMRGGYSGPPDPAIRFDATSVAGRQGLHVHYQISLPDYVVALDDHHYLEIFVDSSSITSPGWRDDAKAAAGAIPDSIRIERKK